MQAALCVVFVAFYTQGSAIKTKKTYTPRINQGGNFCGHSPDSPAFRGLIARLIEATPHKLLKATLRRLGAYYSNPDLYGKLSYILSNGTTRKRRQDGKFRKVRSERDDINLMVMAVCISRVNLVRLQVGIIPYHDPEGLYFAPSAAEIAEAIGASLGRVQRALAHWRNAGYISITKRSRKRSDGSWESLPAVICLHRTVFTLIGITKEALKAAAQFQAKKYKEKREKLFKKAVKKERAMADARREESTDWVFQELMKSVGGLRESQKKWKERLRRKPPGGGGSETRNKPH